MTSSGDHFSQEVIRLRANYQDKRQRSNLFPPTGLPILDMELVRGERPSMRFWYDDGTEIGRFVHLFDIPGTLSGQILRLERNLPPVGVHFEIEGDVLRSLEKCPNPPQPAQDDFEDTEDLVMQLPLLHVDPSQHFVKEAKYRSEIENLLICQGGS